MTSAVPSESGALLDEVCPSYDVASRHAIHVAATRGRAVRAASFTVVAEEPGVELVLGIMGRFWTLDGDVVTVGGDQFREPPPTGLAQAVWNLRVEPEGTGARLSTETRVRCADPATRRRFLRYWRLIRFGSSLTRRSMLQLIRRAAEEGLENGHPARPSLRSTLGR